MAYDCIIIGAGMSGLSAAYALHKHGRDVLVIEASSHVGGALGSERTPEGFVLEHGPNTVVSNDPALWAHVDELGIADQRLTARSSAKKRYILKNGRPEAIPMGPGGLIGTPLLPFASKLRLLAEPLLPRARTSDETVATFFARRLGPEPMKQLVDPFVSGVYAGDPGMLSVRAAFPRLWEAEQRSGSIMRGMLFAKRPKDKPKGRREMINFRDGLGTWTQALADSLGPERVWLDSSATRIISDGDDWQVSVRHNGHDELLEAQHVIVATPAYAAANLVANLDGAAANALRDIPYPAVSVVHLAYERGNVAHPLDGFGMLCPSREGRKVLGILWPSSLFEGRAPEGTVLTTSFIGGARAPELARQSPDQLIATAVAEHEALLGARGEPLLAKTITWQRAIPQYTIGHAQRIEAIRRLEAKNPGLHLLANYRGGISVPQCWQNGRALAEQIAHQAQHEAV